MPQAPVRNLLGLGRGGVVVACPVSLVGEVGLSLLVECRHDPASDDVGPPERDPGRPVQCLLAMDNATNSQKKRNDHEWVEHFADTDNWKSVNPFIYNLVMSKCDDRLKERLQGHNDLSDITAKQNGIRLLALIRSICHCQEDNDMSTLQRAVLDIQIYTAVQGANEKNTAYCDRFRDSMEVADSNGAKIGSLFGTRKAACLASLGRRLSKSDYDTKPKQANKAREIGRAEETEMIGSSVEDHRTIDLDVK
ncbi:hypothetical protein THAOC_12393 [Thalassiosira oceanica]|uniref:Uncharacterized protein n=1 Tax=Thalassiosira oceanica TaxID=159749 RepID=K0T078_THAOC|nr:hypothetical protein THAOC_12393 [Thalassiosira oceanica]|eukprot:EJK66666.1 hypothetical protein THAOC_12393 [Thalassiosira oceanica]